ncbi:hypothetical protein [Methylobacterium radiodurans]|uniref:Uncharacterized protein n=1 Tax=Methylobacterium radiodurans TaxID=2202828 RepID=A0A2U8VS15_9HYPH|nr:hypothetical protein [Methylobacterium radiodurans]AWN36524.1 hypothetical protein DK427_12950 [Methylobacterium radiodurans]
MDVSGPELATILDLTDRQIRSLADQGVVTKLDHGRYALAGSVQGYVSYKVRTEVARVTKDPGEARVRDLRADEIAMRLEERSRALINEARAEALGIVEEICGPLRSDLMSIPARVTKDLALRKVIETQIDGAFGVAAKRAAVAAADARAGSGAAETSPAPNRAARRAARHGRPAR